MTREQARKILGNQPKWALRNMCRALCMMSWENTPEEWRRLAALRVLGYRPTVPIPAPWLWAKPLNRKVTA